MELINIFIEFGLFVYMVVLIESRFIAPFKDNGLKPDRNAKNSKLLELDHRIKILSCG